MGTCPKLFVRMAAASLAAAFMLAATGAVRADEDDEQRALIKKVRPSVVRITIDNSLGSGVVIDAKLGLIATNFHVVNGATKCNVVFPADKDKKEYPVDGFVEVQPGKDLALIRLTGLPKEKKLQALKLADKVPVQGEPVYMFGAPLGLQDTVANGMVSAIRTTADVNGILQRFFGIKGGLGYDNDATWVQHDAPMSHGNSGGPLVNLKAEVVGLNTWVPAWDPGAQRLNFAISSIHIRQLKEHATSFVKPWSQLPHGRHREEMPGGGDPEKTFTAWKKFNLAMYDFNARLVECNKKLESIPKPNLRNPLQGLNVRNRKFVSTFKAFSATYGDFASRIHEKQVGGKGVDHFLTKWFKIQYIFLDRASKSYKELASSIAPDNPDAGAFAELKVFVYRELLDRLHSEYDILRIQLSMIYDREFPRVDETGEEAKKAEKKAAEAAGGGAKPKKRVHVNKDELAGYRIWTSSGGGFQVEAKYLAVSEDGQTVVLRKKQDGKQLEVAIESLSEADQNYIARAREEE